MHSWFIFIEEIELRCISEVYPWGTPEVHPWGTPEVYPWGTLEVYEWGTPEVNPWGTSEVSMVYKKCIYKVHQWGVSARCIHEMVVYICVYPVFHVCIPLTPTYIPCSTFASVGCGHISCHPTVTETPIAVMTPWWYIPMTLVSCPVSNACTVHCPTNSQTTVTSSAQSVAVIYLCLSPPIVLRRRKLPNTKLLMPLLRI